MCLFPSQENLVIGFVVLLPSKGIATRLATPVVWSVWAVRSYMILRPTFKVGLAFLTEQSNLFTHESCFGIIKLVAMNGSGFFLKIFEVGIS